jgi:hypothetical protein
MRHQVDHNPTLDWQNCWTCHQALSAVWARWREMYGLGPTDWPEVVRRMNAEAKAIADGAAS